MKPITNKIDELSPETMEELALLIEQGNYPEIAAKAMGIRPALYYAWIKRGEGKVRELPATPEYTAFAERMKIAEAIAETKITDMVVKGIPKDPALGLKFLSRRFKDRWGETVKHEVSWVIKAVHMLQTGEVTLEALEGELPADDFNLVKIKFLENPVVEGEFVDMTPKVDVDAE